MSKSKLYYIRTTGYDMIAVRHEDYATFYVEDLDHEPFPDMCKIEPEDREKVAIEFLKGVEDDSSFEIHTIEELEEIMKYDWGQENNIVIAELDCDWL